MALNPFVRLRHNGLDATTRQPLSAARHLLASGWAADDAESADLLGVKFTGKAPAKDDGAVPSVVESSATATSPKKTKE